VVLVFPNLGKKTSLEVTEQGMVVMWTLVLEELVYMLKQVSYLSGMMKAYDLLSSFDFLEQCCTRP
jgi:hypothetical protein